MRQTAWTFRTAGSSDESEGERGESRSGQIDTISPHHKLTRPFVSKDRSADVTVRVAVRVDGSSVDDEKQEGREEISSTGSWLLALKDLQRDERTDLN